MTKTRKKTTQNKEDVTSIPDDFAPMIRVNQAGEYGAKRIYAGQLAVLKKMRAAPEVIAQITHMAEQEEMHLQAFNAMVADEQIRPTALQPVWHVAGFALGAMTALMGTKAAMACTVAVEEVIDQHYLQQERALANINSQDKKMIALKKKIAQFRSDENEHRETALAAGAEQMTGYPILRAFIRKGSKAAIWLSQRV
jgi:ubiquinone biosynthesis monooxygenase Coq7